MIVEKIKAYQPDMLGISIVTLAELQGGVYCSNNSKLARQGLNDFLSFVKIIPITEEICEYYGKEYALLRKTGQLIGGFDLLIAVTCLIYNLVLLTNNKMHFEKISGLKIESIID